jgi:hypothetical protein
LGPFVNKGATPIEKMTKEKKYEDELTLNILDIEGFKV